ncbi:MAG: hypothetical protein KBT36_11935 [Kurthia sp.]|nr:hypothetical protein [Candidatus Kurthia equi]
MLTLIIISVILFTSIPLLIVVSLMKSEERQLDMLLQSLGGKASVKTPPHQPTQTKKQSPKNRSGAIRGSQKKTSANRLQKQATANKTPIVKLMSKKLWALKPKFTEFQIKMQVLFMRIYENISHFSLMLRKKMPGYVYPSRDDMLRDQANETSKTKELVEDMKQAKKQQVKTQ